MIAFTDYPVRELGDIEFQEAPIREVKVIGYDLKEVLIIVVIGLIVIFILDLFVKIGRKTINL